MTRKHRNNKGTPLLWNKGTKELEHQVKLFTSFPRPASATCRISPRHVASNIELQVKVEVKEYTAVWKGRRWHGPRCNHYKYNARRIGYFQHGGTLTVSWRWGETGETGETKNDGHGPTIELTPLVGNKRMFSQTCRQLEINLWTVWFKRWSNSKSFGTFVYVVELDLE